MKNIRTKGTQSFNVPNTKEGRKFIQLMFKFANKGDCYIRCRGRGKRNGKKYDAYLPKSMSEWLAVYVTSSGKNKTHAQQLEHLRKLYKLGF